AGARREGAIMSETPAPYHPATMPVLCPDCLVWHTGPTPQAEDCIFCDADSAADMGLPLGEHLNGGLCPDCQRKCTPAELASLGSTVDRDAVTVPWTGPAPTRTLMQEMFEAAWAHAAQVHGLDRGPDVGRRK